MYNNNNNRVSWTLNLCYNLMNYFDGCLRGIPVKMGDKSWGP